MANGNKIEDIMTVRHRKEWDAGATELRGLNLNDSIKAVYMGGDQVVS